MMMSSSFPHYIDFSTAAVSLATSPSRNVRLSIPCVASPVDTVSEAHMAAAMAALGGIGFVHSNCSAMQQASIIGSAKLLRVPIAPTVGFVEPDVAGRSGAADGNYVFVTESGCWGMLQNLTGRS
ncbi:hypothetical protein SLE2022_093640 [Rubroshorea leprosula]